MPLVSSSMYTYRPVIVDFRKGQDGGRSKAAGVRVGVGSVGQAWRWGGGGIVLTITTPFVMSTHGNNSTGRQTQRPTFVLHVPNVSAGTFYLRESKKPLPPPLPPSLPSLSYPSPISPSAKIRHVKGWTKTSFFLFFPVWRQQVFSASEPGGSGREQMAS